VAFDPANPDLMYLMWQEGMLYRKDRKNDEGLMIRPQPAEGDSPERWNWDSPLLVSSHSASRIYYGSQRVWRSDDMGSSWTAISGDLTHGRNRYEQKFFGRVWSVDALHDNGAMSKYATTTSIAESPVAEGTLAVGTDDGLVQVTSNGGQSWTRAAALPGLPALSFINDVELSVRDASTVYVVADNHKTGDFTPYLFESTDLGRTWRSMAGDLPKGTIAWAIQQDHVRPDLFFLGTEFGVYFSPNRGANWHKLSGGAPTIPFRDLKIHRRDHDLVGATFGRGFYVLDDFRPLREMASGALAGEGVLFPVRAAWWFVPTQPGQAPGRPELGTDDFTTPNPPHGALLTYWLREAPTTAREAREAAEKGLREKGLDAPFPGFERLRAEAVEQGAKVLLRVTHASGVVVRWIEGPAKAGLHRVNWDLRGANPDPVDLNPPAFRSPWDEPSKGPLVAPGSYSAELVVVSASGVRSIGSGQSFEVKPVPNLPPGTDPVAVAAFQQQTAEAGRRMAAAGSEISRIREQLRHMRATLVETPRAERSLYGRLDSLSQSVAGLARRLNGDPARQRLDESDAPSIGGRVGSVMGGHWETRQMPTVTQRRELEMATAGLDVLERDLKALITGELALLEEAFAAAGAPWTPGRRAPQ
jgi:hypothetical protein